MVGDVELPDVNPVPREAQMLVGVVGGAGLDDDRGAVLAGAKVREVASVQETLDGVGVGVLSLVLGHQRRPQWRSADDSCRGRSATSSETDVPRSCSSGG